MITATRRAAALNADHERRIASLEAQVAELQRQLLLSRDPRDQWDANLRRVLASSTNALPFKAAELLKHAEVDDELRQALDSAFIETAGALGAWLRNHQGGRDGILILRLPRRQWRVTYT